MNSCIITPLSSILTGDIMTTIAYRDKTLALKIIDYKTDEIINKQILKHVAVNRYI